MPYLRTDYAANHTSDSSVSPLSIQPFHDPVTSVILEQLGKMQEAILTTEVKQID